VIFAICVVVAVASLAIPVAIAYDPWAWLVWGREIARFQLDTVGGPSWKPLPVLATTLLAPFGDSAPTLWLVASRTGALLAIVGVYRLAARFAGAWAGVVAVGALVLAPDPGPRFTRLVLEGHSAPITAALAVWAIDRHLEGRHATALVLGTALALDRPEAWPFLALYAVWLWRNERALRPLTGALLALVPIIWFGGDWWGSGNPLHGADAARVIADDQHRLVDGIRRVGEVVIAPAWIAAAIAVVDAWRRRDRVLLVLAAGAMTWFALVVGMSAVFGYAALSRFLLPGAAVVCVLAGVGVVRLFAALPAGSVRIAAVAAFVVVSLPLVVLRADGLGREVADVEARHGNLQDLDAAIEKAGGPEAVVRSGRVSVDDFGVPRVAAAWILDVPLADVHAKFGPARGTAMVENADRAARRAERRGLSLSRKTTAGDWDVYAVNRAE
jgi:hypothetical protein